MRGGLKFGVLVLVLASCSDRNVVVADREGDGGTAGGMNEGGSGNGGAGAGGSVTGAGGSSAGTAGGTQTGGTGAGATGGSAGDAQASAGEANSAGGGMESGGSSGAGTNAGSGGSDGGNAAEAGSGASGGAADRDCETIVAEYGEALRDATACNPVLSVEQCTLLVPANTGCDCETFANPANAEALQRLEDLAREVSGCERPCPTTCGPTARGVCGSGTGDYGICYGVN